MTIIVLLTSVIPFSINLWLHCLYKNHAKPLTQYYENSGTNHEAYYSPQFAPSFNGPPQIAYQTPNQGYANVHQIGIRTQNRGLIAKPQARFD